MLAIHINWADLQSYNESYKQHNVTLEVELKPTCFHLLTARSRQSAVKTEAVVLLCHSHVIRLQESVIGNVIKLQKKVLRPKTMMRLLCVSGSMSETGTERTLVIPYFIQFVYMMMPNRDLQQHNMIFSDLGS